MWRFVSAPLNANPAFTSGANTARPQFKANLVGDYVIELVVRDALNCQSAADTVTVHVVPDKKVLVELSWPQDFGDVDLHYIGPGGAFWNARSDVHFRNKTPDWGLNNTTAADTLAENNPALDIDDVWGNGPENVTHGKPFDGTYQVWLHYYCSRTCASFFGCSGSYGPATPTVRIFIDGVKQFESSKSLTQRDVWEVAAITVSNNGASVAVTPVTVPLYKSATNRGCSSAGN